MKLHHVGYVISTDKLNLYKRKFNYVVDKVQKNYIFFDFAKEINIWNEYIIPFSKESTVYNYLLKNKNKNNIHHFGFFVSDIIKKKRQLINNGCILIGNYKINVPSFGGVVNTKFFFIMVKI